MLIGIASCISPDLLAVLHRMGHGDEIVFADAHFPGHTIGPQVLRADGIAIPQLLDGILRLVELDSYATPLVMMDAVAGDTLDSSVERDYMQVIRKHVPAAQVPERIDRHAFYERARKAFAIVITGEIRKYGNLILKKGVTPRE
jgi:L-fucose mutarotase